MWKMWIKLENTYFSTFFGYFIVENLENYIFHFFTYFYIFEHFVHYTNLLTVTILV